MKSFFDTSVLVATSVEVHEHHERSFALFTSADRKTACCAAHGLAELYATLTRLPGRARMSADQALLVLDSVEERLEIVSLDAREYRLAIQDAATAGIVGGTIYDALIGWSALKAGATRIYTWDVADFRRLGAEIANKVRTP
ncbi:MAG: PIN domain-containing protein [Terriglobales bacterium]